MDNTKLIDYLQTVLDLEKKKYEQEMMLRNINNRIPMLRNKPPVRYYMKREPPELPFSKYFLYLILGVILTIIVYTFSHVALEAIVLSYDLKNSSTIIDLISWGITIICIIVLVVRMIMGIKQYMKQFELYKEECKNIDNMNDNIDINVLRDEEETNIAVARLNGDAIIINNELVKTKELLTKYYAMGILYPKYQNVIAVSSILEYLLSGVCTDLGGHEGAYNKYDNEVLLRAIIGKLDNVLNNLERIKDNQRILYTVIYDGNKNIYEMMNKINSSNERLIDTMDNFGNKMTAHLSAVEYAQKAASDNTRYLLDLETYKYWTK